MISPLRKYPIQSVVVALLVGAVLATLVVGFFFRPTVEAEPGDRGASVAPSPSPTEEPVASGCGSATTNVSTADELHAALGAAVAGDVIVLAPGSYAGNFVASASGSATKPIVLCGTTESVLDGGGTDDNYVFHLDGAQYWHLIGFSVTNGQKGVIADTTVGSVIEGLTVSHTGDEAIHLRNFSTDNVVRNNTVSDTGHRKPKFGEGIYVGSAESNWCDVSGCAPDASDRNLIEGNTISGTTAESVDIKEGTTGGVLRGNSFDGSGLVAADSWVDVKGNGWLIEGNAGTNSPQDGFQTHEILDGWGRGNHFTQNSAAVNGPGFGFSLTPVLDNVVDCTNTVSAAGEGMSNRKCAG